MLIMQSLSHNTKIMLLFFLNNLDIFCLHKQYFNKEKNVKINIFFAAPWFELSASQLLGRCFYCLRNFSIPFWNGFFQDRVLWSICLGWLQIAILLISASWVARITGMSPCSQVSRPPFFIACHNKVLAKEIINTGWELCFLHMWERSRIMKPGKCSPRKQTRLQKWIQAWIFYLELIWNHNILQNLKH
jgi:hypothetical protein